MNADIYNRKIIIKNNILGRYDYISLWIDEEEYRLKPESEISVEVFDNEILIEFSIYFSKRKKIFLEFEDKDEKEIYFKLNMNKYFFIYCLLSLILFFLLVLLMLLPYIYPNLNIRSFFFIPLYIYVIFFSYWWFFKGTVFIDLVRI